jgi:hypothetical protein
MISNGTMTLMFRNGFLTLLLVLTAVLLSAYMGALVLLWAEPEWDLWVQGLPSLATGFLGLIWMRRVYRKFNLPMAFFFAAFFFCVAMDSLKVAQAFLLIENQPFAYGVLLTRVVWGVRLAALFLLLVGSLFLVKFTYQNYGALLLATFAGALVLAIGLPLQTSEPDPQGLYPVGDSLWLALFFALIMAVTTVNHVLSWVRVAQTDVAQGQQASLISTQIAVWGLVLVGWGAGLAFSPWFNVLFVPAVVLLGRQARSTVL